MWTRTELKSRAKAVLRVNYWRALLISLVLLVSGAGYASSGINWNWSNDGNQKTIAYYANRLVDKATRVINNGSSSVTRIVVPEHGVVSTYVYRISPGNVFTRVWNFVASNFNPIALIIGFGLLVFGLFMLFFRVIIGYPLEVGARRYFIYAADFPNTDFNHLGLCFKNGSYLNVVFTMFLRSLYTFLWSLLFVIPGIVKSISYSMTPYILADNPQLSPSRALELSQKMTYGHKWEIFVLNLSFLGWYLLGNICLGIGVVFVYPYDNATKAELYLTLRNRALDSGLVSCEELCLTRVYDYVDMTGSPEPGNHN